MKPQHAAGKIIRQIEASIFTEISFNERVSRVVRLVKDATRGSYADDLVLSPGARAFVGLSLDSR
jgi:hypothetical protein